MEAERPSPEKLNDVGDNIWVANIVKDGEINGVGMRPERP